MLNITDLENRWRRYRYKKSLPRTLALLFISAILFIVIGYKFFLLTNTLPKAQNNIQSSESSTFQTSSESISSKSYQQTNTSATQNTLKHSFSSSHSIIISPSFDFINNVKENQNDPLYTDIESNYHQEKHHSFSSKSSLFYNQSINKKPASQSTLSSKTNIINSNNNRIYNTPRPKADIKRESSLKDIQDVINRFKKSKNPALSLFVAKRFYELGNYQESYNYALITNELNSNIEDSWLIFSKSLYQLKQKEMAIKTLKTYILESNSVKAKILMEQMKKGSFR